MAYASNEDLFPVWREPRSVWERTGLSRRAQRRLDVALVGVTLLLLGGWIYSTVHAIGIGASPSVARRLGGQPSLLSPNAPPPATFLLETAIERFTDWEELYGGESGALRVVVEEPGDSVALPDSVPEGVEVVYRSVEAGDTAQAVQQGDGSPRTPGIWNVLLRVRDAIRPVPELSVVTLVPATELRGGRIGGYRIGSWPEQTGRYAPPRGFVRVTPENMDTYVSEHVRLRDFLTKGQEDVWPKYVVMSPLALDKVELTLQELERRGHPVENIFVISGFRTPWYNRTGGDTSGRGALSRHMYGDALDFAIDNDNDTRMDDLNGDGRVNVADARVIGDAAEAVERAHPNLIGGIGIYRPTGAHSGFVHLDTRGYRARW
jgi:uncharacterized protein YcbK (DUF882 family)